jgi:type IV secretory pathway TrbF-like protein
MPTPNTATEIKRLNAFYGGSMTALRVSALANVVLILSLAAMAYTLHDIRSQVSTWKPVVIRVDEAGTAVPIDLTTATAPATEVEVKAFCGQYVEWIQSYDPHNLNRDLGRAFACTVPETAQQLANYFRSDPAVQQLQRTGALVDCHLEAVQILHNSPWEVQVTYTLTNTSTSQKTKWYALLTLKPTERSFNDPFGLLVTGVRINNAI